MSVDIEKEDFVVSEFLRSIGPWRKHIVLGGGYALIIYKLYLVNQSEGNPPVGTRDLDSLIPRKIPEASKKDISEHLIEAGFKLIFKDFGNPATESYVKEINGSELEIEFLTDDNTRHSKGENVTIAGVAAQPLPYLKQSLSNAVEFETYTGEKGNVVSPHAWIFHKGLTFPKRSDKVKIYKDLYGIWYAASQLQALSEHAIAELKILAQHYPRWFKTFQKNLHEWVQDATPADWIKLETQDPFGSLKKASFLHLVKTITDNVKFKGQHLSEKKILDSQSPSLGQILAEKKG